MIRVNSDSAGNYLNRWKIQAQNGAADSSLLLRNAPFTTALFPRDSGATDMHQQREENTHEDILVHGMVRAVVHRRSNALYTTTAPALDLIKRATIEG